MVVMLAIRHSWRHNWSLQLYSYSLRIVWCSHTSPYTCYTIVQTFPKSLRCSSPQLLLLSAPPRYMWKVSATCLQVWSLSSKLLAYIAYSDTEPEHYSTQTLAHAIGQKWHHHQATPASTYFKNWLSASDSSRTDEPRYCQEYSSLVGNARSLHISFWNIFVHLLLINEDDDVCYIYWWAGPPRYNINNQEAYMVTVSREAIARDLLQSYHRL